MDELVSIIIPAYNVEGVIADTITSAMSQTWPKKEIIIVDDGSTDGTLAVAKTFESKLVKVVAQPNKGASAARNEGLRFAQGSFIQWLDADDLLTQDKVSRQLKFADRGQDGRVLLTSSFGTFYFCHQRSQINPTILWQDLSPVDWLMNKFKGNVWMNPAVWLVSRKLTELAGPWDERLVRDNDGEYICRVVAASERVQFVGEAMSYYRVGNLGSLSTSTSDKTCESLVLALSLSIQYLLSLENSERTRSACLNLLQIWVPFLYPDKEEWLRKMDVLASQLGGQLTPPEVSWKYYLIKKCFGWKTTKKVITECRRTKLKAVKTLDRVLHDTIYKSRILS